MTCIVGIEHEGVVYLGGDSAGVAGYQTHRRQDEKVFVNDGVVMGFTTSFRMGQLLRYAFTPPEQSSKKDDMAYLVTDFIDAVRSTFETKGFLAKEDERESGGTFMLGYHGKLYVVYGDFQVGRTHEGYAACGCGEDLALGSLHSTRGNPDPVWRLRTALEAAEHFSAGVSAPFTFVTGKGVE